MIEAVLLALGVMILLIVLGTHIAVGLGLSAMLGVYLMMENFDIVLALLADTAYDAVRNYIFAVIPLFILMGDIVSRSGLAGDVYRLCNRMLIWLPGRLAVSTVLGNAIFAAVSGVSVAAAASFSRIAYPEMDKYQYNRKLALGSIAGSSVLGMLIPPSILLIVWAVMTEMSIGALFVAGVVPGLVLAAMFCGYCVLRALRSPGMAPNVRQDEVASSPDELRRELSGGVGVVVLVSLVLGGLWGGLFTPTEAAGIGVMGALVLGIIRGMKIPDIYQAVLHAGQTAAPIMLLLVAAQLYSRMLAMGGVVPELQHWVTAAELSPFLLILAMMGVWLVMGMFVDSVSIILLTIPVFAPMAQIAGFDALAFAIFGILVIEAGLLTPPFGLVCYTVKGAIPDPSVTLQEIFSAVLPYIAMVLVVAALVLVIPALATWLPAVAF
uniref:TRAP transporter large permease n=1 Tax=Marinobacterium profundum TaxID=1714300 RepID=UPI000831D3AB|nr:TRAP transporter large permease [Marinobacterium profundum]